MHIGIWILKKEIPYYNYTMILLITNTLIVTIFIICITALSPINLGILVLSVAFLIAIRLSIFCSRWFGFITFIIYVGGILVIFAYFAALQPNQHITNWSWVYRPATFLIILSLLFNNNTLIAPINTFKIHDIYSITNLAIPVMIALILFLALIIVVKTARADQGPLRPFNYV